MKVTLLTPEKTLFEGQATFVEVPGAKGRFQMLDHHAPIVSILSAGKVRIVLPDNSEKLFDIQGGVIELKNDIITILAE
ncbi:MAG: F0F1 ATP synthase subunit epsilon [Bacteroidales bacterium]|nr:F0F1 ATP synthase subunit epsilon [Bacteroidales bacterium]HOY37946.1 hypothetical protein [Bacteroidales bacterium]HQP03197.1 hypothetical protein [Bacteroidales bacterium]